MSDRLYELLPAIYRSLDLARGEPLRALMGVMDEQYDALRANIAELYEDWFVETCQEWVVPYQGELLGLRGLLDANALLPVQRALVANTLAYRRRKGVAAALQPLTRDATAWYARAVDARSRLATAQNVLAVDLGQGGSVNVARAAAASSASSVFDNLAHTPDFGRLATDGSLWNLPSVLLFLWRLVAYPLERATPAVVTTQGLPGLFVANPLGFDQPLFNLPLSPLPASRTAQPVELPVALTRAALGADLDAYRARYEALPATAQPANSAFYGPERGLLVLSDGQQVPPVNVVAADLSAWALPPAQASVMRSGPLDPFPVLAAPAQLEATIGGIGPFTLRLEPVPSSLADAAAALQQALRSASLQPAFAAASVLAQGDSLSVVPGSRGLPVAFAAAPGDSQTVRLLKLDAAEATTIAAALSWPLFPLPRLAANAQMSAMLDGEGPGIVTLSPPPQSLEALRAQLQAALRAANPESLAFTESTVSLVGQALLVVPGPARAGVATSVAFEATAFDPATIVQLGLAGCVAVDPELGRIAFPLSAAAKNVQVSSTTASAGDVGGGPYRRSEQLADPATVAMRLDVGAGPGQTSLSTAIAEWVGAGQPRAVFRILDSATYPFLITTLQLPANGLLAIEAQQGQRPVLQLLTGFNVVAPGGQAAAFTLSGVVVDGPIGIGGGGALEASFVDCTLLPRRGPTYRFAPTGALGVPRSDHTATLLSNGSVLVAGGQTGSASAPEALASAELYQPGERAFQATGSMNTPRSQHTATAMEGKVLMVGGRNGSQAVGSVEAYDPGTGSFTTLSGVLQQPRWGHSATILGNSGMVLILGGQDEQGLVALVELLNPFTGEVTQVKAPLDPPRILHTTSGLVSTNLALVVGGQTAGGGPAVQPLVFDGDAQTFAPTVNQPFPAGYGQSASVLTTPGFPVLLIGGQNLGGFLKQAWEYTPNPTPVQGSFNTTPGTLLQARAQHSATQLPSGELLVAGGLGASGTLASSEFFDASTGFFAAGPSLGQARVDHSATLLTNGDVLVAGGQDATGTALASCEQLEPAGPGYTSPYAIVGTAGATAARVSVRRCLSGGVVWSQQGRELRIEDSAVVAFGDASAPAVSGVDPTQPGPPLRAERVTFLGRVSASRLEASDVIFSAGVELPESAVACLRFSYVPPQPDGTFTPAEQGYRCQPYYALAEAAAELGLRSPADLPPWVRDLILLEVRPEFTSTRYPDPGFLQLAMACSRLISEGGSNGAEMGLFNFLRQPQRVALLRRLLADALPLGRAAGLVYVT